MATGFRGAKGSKERRCIVWVVYGLNAPGQEVEFGVFPYPRRADAERFAQSIDKGYVRPEKRWITLENANV